MVKKYAVKSTFVYRMLRCRYAVVMVMCTYEVYYGVVICYCEILMLSLCRNAFQLRTNCVPTAYQLRTNCVPTAYQLRTNCVPTAVSKPSLRSICVPTAYQMRSVNRHCVSTAYQLRTKCGQ